MMVGDDGKAEMEGRGGGMCQWCLAAFQSCQMERDGG
jgi:hypothetical protein